MVIKLSKDDLKKAKKEISHALRDQTFLKDLVKINPKTAEKMLRRSADIQRLLETNYSIENDEGEK